LPSSLDRLSCFSWLVYATKGDTEAARRVKGLILAIKKDRIDAATGQPMVRLVVDRAANAVHQRRTKQRMGMAVAQQWYPAAFGHLGHVIVR
jgi:hypothetical protein